MANIIKPAGQEKADSGSGLAGDPFVPKFATTATSPGAIKRPWGYEKAASGSGTADDPYIPLVVIVSP